MRSRPQLSALVLALVLVTTAPSWVKAQSADPEDAFLQEIEEVVVTARRRKGSGGGRRTAASREQLFDLVNDPGEMQPVTYSPEYRAQLFAHRYMLLDWDQRIGDDDFSPAGQFPEIPGPAYGSSPAGH